MQNSIKAKGAILEAASSLFDRYGYEKTTIDQIAKASRKAKASIYYHFDSKLSIFRACLENEFRQLQSALEEISDQGPVNEHRFKEYLTKRMEMIPSMVVYRNYIINYVTSPFRTDVKAVADGARAGFDKFEYNFLVLVARKGREDRIFPDKIQPAAFADMVIALLKGIELQFFVSDDLDAMRSTYESLVSVLVDRGVDNK